MSTVEDGLQRVIAAGEMLMRLAEDRIRSPDPVPQVHSYMANVAVQATTLDLACAALSGDHMFSHFALTYQRLSRLAGTEDLLAHKVAA